MLIRMTQSKTLNLIRRALSIITNTSNILNRNIRKNNSITRTTLRTNSTSMKIINMLQSLNSRQAIKRLVNNSNLIIQQMNKTRKPLRLIIIIIMRLRRLMSTKRLLKITSLQNSPPMRTNKTNIKTNLTINMLMNTITIQGNRNIIISTLIDNHLILPQTSSRRYKLTKLRKFTNHNIIRAQSNMTTIMRIARLLRRNLILLKISKSLTINNMRTNTITLRMNNPTKINRHRTMLQAIKLNRLLNSLRRLIPNNQGILINRTNNLPRINIMPRKNQHMTRQGNTLLFLTISIRNSLLSSIIRMITNTIILINMRVKSTLRNTISKPTLTIINANNSRIQTITNNSLNSRHLTSNTPQLRLNISLMLVLKLIRIIGSKFRHLTINFKRTIPRNSLRLTINNLLSIATTSITKATTNRHRTNHGRNHHNHSRILLSLR